MQRTLPIIVVTLVAVLLLGAFIEGCEGTLIGRGLRGLTLPLWEGS